MGGERHCQRIVDTADGRTRCPYTATWLGWAHAGRDIYIVEACDRHHSGLIDAEPLDGDWDRRPTQSRT